jgi:homoserine acetyltransferase
MANNVTNTVILAFRIPPEVRDGIAIAARKRFSGRTEYLRQVIVDAVNRDGGFTDGARDRG